MSRIEINGEDHLLEELLNGHIDVVLPQLLFVQLLLEMGKATDKIF